MVGGSVLYSFESGLELVVGPSGQDNEPLVSQNRGLTSPDERR